MTLAGGLEAQNEMLLTQYEGLRICLITSLPRLFPLCYTL